MQENKSNIVIDRIPTTAMEVQGELCKLFYKEFKERSIPIIKKVFGEYGKYVGNIMKNKIKGEVEFKEAFELYLKPVMKREPVPEFIKFTDKAIHIKIFFCPWNLQGAGQELCEAMTEMDIEILKGLLGFNLDLKLIKTLAAGDECCEVKAFMP